MNAVLEAIRVASTDGLVDANRVRPHIPEWVPPQTVGRVYSKLRRAGVLERVDWVSSTDEKGGNAGKPIPVYAVRAPIVLRASVAREPVEPSTPSVVSGPTLGPCARCRAVTVRYGPAGAPLCGGCAP